MITTYVRAAIGCLMLLSAQAAFAETLPTGCFSGRLTDGIASGTRVRMLVTRASSKRFKIVEYSGDRSFGTECAGEETPVTRYKVAHNAGLKQFSGKQGNSCEFGLVRSTVSVKSRSATKIDYSREEVYFFGAGGGGYARSTSSGILREREGACSDLE